MSEKKWYAIQTFAGSELAVKRAIENIMNELGWKDKLGEIIVPTEEVIDIKNGKKKITERCIYPGYVFVELEDLDKNTALWQKIQSLPKVGGFIGESNKPTPLSKSDIDLIIEKARQKSAPKPKISFTHGETVRIVEGPFANFTGTVEEYDLLQGKLKLNVTIFGRSTPVEIPHTQVEKII
jgi:transcriptional antiterminator NusG